MRPNLFIAIFCVVVTLSFARAILADSSTSKASEVTVSTVPTESSPPAIKKEPISKLTDPLKSAVNLKSVDVPWSITVSKIIRSILIFTVFYLAIKYSTRILEAFSDKQIGSRLVIKRFIPIFRVIGWTVIIYVIIFRVIAPPVETLLALTASAGIALGFSSQDILKNIFGGVMIILDRPFQVGDRIQVKDHYGEVIQIGLRTVRIVTADDSVVSIPNSDVVNQPVSNSNSGVFNCQVVAEFYFPITTDLELLKKLAYRSAAVSRFYYAGKPINVIFKNVVSEGRILLKMRLKAYVLDLRYEHQFASEMTEIMVKEALKRHLIPSDPFQTLQTESTPATR